MTTGRFICLSLALVLAVIAAPSRLRAEEPQEGRYEAEASASVAGGNVAQARQEALGSALRAAVARAGQDILGAAQVGQEGLQGWPAKPENYILSYRVVAEGELPQPEIAPALEGGTAGQAPPAEVPTIYSVRVEANVSLSAVRRDLRSQGVLAVRDVLPPVVAYVAQATGGVNDDVALELLLRALHQSGFRVKPGWGAPTSLAEGEMGVGATVAVECGGPAGCRAQAGLVGRGRLLTAQSQAASPGESGEAALSEALRLAADALAKELVAHQRTERVLLSLKGLTSQVQLAQLKAALEETGSPGRERSLQAGLVVLEVEAWGGPEALGRRLTGRGFDGFGLIQSECGPGRLTLEVAAPGQVSPEE